MNKTIIGALVGAVILFIWQFLSWGMLNLHAGEMSYTDGQDEIMEVLGTHLTEGSYFLPNVPSGASDSERQTAMQESIGKPWATISYHESMTNNMTMNMIRGFIVNFIALYLFLWLILKIPSIDVKTTVLGALAVGLIGYLLNPYMDSIWFENSTLMYLVDSVVSWGLVGVWLGWWLNR